jgi:hypothetical protein
LKIGNCTIRHTLTLILASVVAALAIFPVPAVPATIPEADPEKGLVVFYRPKKMGGSAIRFNVNHSEGSLGVLNNGAVLYRYFEPGQHQFWSQVISQDSIMINVEAAKVYFVKGEVKMGVVAGRPKFRQVDQATGRAEVAKL